MRGPDLSHVGKEHNADWIMKYVRDPKSMKQNSRMPPQDEKKINADDLRTVADYLAGLK
jgi:cbb3-type cytochrome oxidase cytochrome c subunit